MELSINQLAELKIAIEKENQKLENLKKELNRIEPQYNHMVSETIRLEREVSDQGSIKDFLVVENKKLRKEKDLINGEYEKRNQENYEKQKELQDSINQTQELLNLRTLEVEKREANIFHKQEENKNTIKEINKIKKEIGEERLFLERLSTDNEEKLKEISKQIKDKSDILNELAKRQEDLEIKEIDLNNKEKEIQIQIQKNNELLIENQTKEKINQDITLELDGFKKFLIEVKNFTLENINKDLTKKLKDKYEMIENTLLNGVITNDIEIDDKDIQNLSIKDIRQLLTNKGIEYNPQNFNKQSLIKLLK